MLPSLEKQIADEKGKTEFVKVNEDLRRLYVKIKRGLKALTQRPLGRPLKLQQLGGRRGPVHSFAVREVEREELEQVLSPRLHRLGRRARLRNQRLLERAGLQLPVAVESERHGPAPTRPPRAP